MKLNTVLKYATDLDGWARADEMRGAADPDDREYIHEQYLLARKRLRRSIRELAANTQGGAECSANPPTSSGN